MENINTKRTNGILLRSKAEWIEGAEKKSKYFSNLEKRNAEKKVISKGQHTCYTNNNQTLCFVVLKKTTFYIFEPNDKL